MLVPLSIAPLSTFAAQPELYSTCFVYLIQYILTIPLLPNRLPLQLLTQFSSRLPLKDFHLLMPGAQALTSLDLLDTIHLLANFAMLVPPRYKTLSNQAFNAYLKITRSLILKVPPSAFNSPSSGPTSQLNTWNPGNDDSDDDDDLSAAGPSSQPAPPKKLPFQLDAKVRSRLQTFGSTKHASALLAASNAQPSTRLELYGYFLTLYTVWPSCRADILASVLVNSSSGLLRELCLPTCSIFYTVREVYEQ